MMLFKTFAGTIVFSFASAIVQKTPSTQPICQGITDTGPGGMFGYSVAMSNGEGDFSWMAIGKPWDCSVHIYVSRNPKPVPTSNTTGNVTLPTTTTPPDWKPLQQLSDTANGTYPLRSYSLFGYTLDMTTDGAWLAVGVPGRSYAPLSQSISLQSHSFSGSVKIFRRIDEPTVPLQDREYRYMGEIPNPNTGRRFWDKFGSNVKFFSPEDGSKTYLMIAADAGWDGASTNTTGSPPGTSGWPNPPTSDTSRAGIYLYHLLQPSAITPPQGPIAAFNGIFRYVQFLPQLSTAPLGTVGIQMDVLEVPTNEKGGSSIVLMMRDYIIPPGLMDEEQYRAQCPSGTCTYVVMDNLADISGKTTLNATGVVTFFVLDRTTGLFVRDKENLLSPYGFPVEPYADPKNINNGYGEGKWIRDTWFGASVAVAWDRLYGRLVTAVGAPKDAQGVFTYFRADKVNDTFVSQVFDAVSSSLKTAASIFSTSADPWTPGQYITNPTHHRRSSFGSSLSFSRDGKFLLLADPIGPAMTMGQGEVYLYYRRSKAETLVPSVYASVPLPPIQSTTVPYSYDRIGQFLKTPSSIFNQTTIQSDHFGKAIGVNKWWVIVSSPLDQCVYSFDLPYAIQTSDDLSPPKPLPTYTIVPETPTSVPQPIETSNVWIYGLVAGIVAILLVIPLVWYLIKRQHRKKIMQQMEEEQTIEALRETEDSLEQVNQTRVGTEEDLTASGQNVATSHDTLLDTRLDNQI